MEERSNVKGMAEGRRRRYARMRLNEGFGLVWFVLCKCKCVVVVWGLVGGFN